MLQKFLTTLTIEITNFLINHKNFFDLSEKQRQEALQTTKIPSEIKIYLSSATFADFTKQFYELVIYLKNPLQLPSQNSFIQATAKFFNKNFATDLYALPLDYFTLPHDSQIEIADKLITSDSPLAISLKQILVDYSYQEISEVLQNLFAECFNSPMIIVQSPIEIDADTKKQIHQKLSEEVENICFPFFQVNKKIIGGLRIFIDGKVTDLSWLGKINLITSLKSI